MLKESLDYDMERSANSVQKNQKAKSKARALISRSRLLVPSSQSISVSKTGSFTRVGITTNTHRKLSDRPSGEVNSTENKPGNLKYQQPEAVY